MYALVDCNNFYASCERIFNPKLIGQPIVVLSNNDGCIIARSNEAKALGIEMAQPLFMVRDIIKFHKVHVFSSNYELYNDINRRMFNILRMYTPSVEVYSVDEAFMDISGTLIKEKVTDYGLIGYRIQDQIQRCLGLPISVGIGSTKTLAKVANHFAKKLSYNKGVFDITTNENIIDLYLNHLSIEDVWGVGRQYNKLLRHNGIETAYHFKIKPSPWIRKNLTVAGLRLQHELKGIPCHALTVESQAKKSIVVSRSFGQPLHDYDSIKQAVLFFATRVATKLRQQNLKAKGVGVLLTTKFFGNQAFYHSSETCNFLIPCQDDYSFITYAQDILNKTYKHGYLYKKAGVFAYGLFDERLSQHEIFHQANLDDTDKSLTISQALDTLNDRFGSHTVNYGMALKSQAWQAQKQFSSPRYTTRWNEILTII